MRRWLTLAAFSLLAFSTTGCISLSGTEKNKLQELKAEGVRIPEEKVKSPFLAGFLNIFFGAGNCYLGVGTNESSQFLIGFLNLITWPLSILWGVPEAAIDAGTINKRETVYFYSYGPGKEILEKKKAAETAPKPAS